MLGNFKLFVCQQASGFQFDEQSFLFWDYARSLNLIPFRDFFYPYGLLFFLKTDSLFWYLVSLVAVVFTVGFILVVFRNITKDKLYTFTLFLAFFFFASLFLDYDSFLRYSPLVVISFLVSYLANKKDLINKKWAILLGIILGLLFSFINDVFFYGFVTVALFTSIYVFLNKKLDLKILEFTAFLIAGIFIGSIPLLLYLAYHGAFGGIVENYHLLASVSSFAKVPFPPTLKSFENLFIIAVLIISIISLWPHLKKKSERNLTFYIKLSLVIVVILMEQKNIVRSFYQQLSIFGFLLFLILINEFRIKLTKLHVSKRLIYIYCLNLIILVFVLIYFDRGVNFNGQKLQSNISTSCIEKKLASLDKAQLKNYKEVKDFVSKDKNHAIFSFPGDPIFYVLLGQNPPYYPSIYEATPIFAQEKLIKYIKDNDINYVIFNNKSTAIQDGVPDKIRSAKLYNFIVDNFTPVGEIEYFQILKRK